MRGKGILYAAVLALLAASPAEAAEKIGGRLAALLRSASGNERFTVWIHFGDKGPSGLARPSAETLVSPRSLQRRRNVLPQGAEVDFDDVPVEASYVRQLESMGVEIRQRSKWFNAVSATLPASQIPGVARLPFVSEVELLFRLKRDSRVRTEGPAPAPPPFPRKTDGGSSLDYGSSLPQVALLRIPEVHDGGNAGQDVIVGVFDNGFRLPKHESIDSLRIIATYDFVDHKISVVPLDTGGSGSGQRPGAHGIYTLSTLAGYAPGQLIGPAYGAAFILARTENDSSETPVEEDNWIAAAEWADSIGVQITSTSLGYLQYDPPYTSWTWQDMNGTTTKISRAATIAARKGIVVVNSAGNNSDSGDPNINTLNAPADADSILAVGAVTPSGTRASFSSVGPTTSVPPRIKPDIMATGTSIFCASGTAPNGYVYVQGTSLSCPLAAGVAAMMLHAVPAATPMQVIEALKTTASNASSPNNTMGWGVIDAVKAIGYLQAIVLPGIPTAIELDQNFPNPFNPSTAIRFGLTTESSAKLVIYDLLGREVRILGGDTRPPGRYIEQWDGNDARGVRVASGMYIYRLETTDAAGVHASTSRKMMLVR